MSEYDLVIVGAGPAGATLARLLGKAYRILLIDDARPKCCGGLLAPDAQEMIARLGLVLPDAVLQGPQLFSVLARDFDNGTSRHYQRHYINVDRERFDSWLLSLVPPQSLQIVRGRYQGCDSEQRNELLTVRFQENGKSSTARTRILVGADGAFSLVRRQFFSDHPDRKMYLALQHWFEAEAASSCFGAIFDREITDYYSWTIPKGNLLIVGSAIPLGSDVRGRFERLLKKLRGKMEWGNLLRKEASQIVRPVSVRALCPCCNESPVVLIGEAAGWISPSSAEGISYAMRSALALADALKSGIEGFRERYIKNLRPLYRNIFLKNLKKPAMYVPNIRKWILKTGLLSLEVRE